MRHEKVIGDRTCFMYRDWCACWRYRGTLTGNRATDVVTSGVWSHSNSDGCDFGCLVQKYVADGNSGRSMIIGYNLI